VQYAPKKRKAKNNFGLDLEEIINLVSKCHEDSKVIVSRIETQFSEITL